MKIKIMITLTIAIVLVFSTTVYAGTSDRSERTKEPRTSSSETIAKPISGRSEGYGSKNSYDEFHTVPRDINANDKYRSGRIDELHINENYKQDVWHPEDRGMRINGFDEFHFPDEM